VRAEKRNSAAMPRLSIFRSRKGSAYIYLVLLALIFCVILVYNVFSETLSIVEPEVKTFLNETVNQTNSTVAAQALSTIDIVGTVWHYWPILFLLLLFVWAWVSSQRKEPYYEGY